MNEIGRCQPAADLCSELRETLGCDFVGLAIQNRIGPDIRWHIAVGSTNEKYQRITVRFGKGIAGKVLSTGSPIMVENFQERMIGKATDYPIMLAEKLASAYAVPLFFNGVPKGVLLIGNRDVRSFTTSCSREVRRTASELEEILGSSSVKFEKIDPQNFRPGGNHEQQSV